MDKGRGEEVSYKNDHEVVVILKRIRSGSENTDNYIDQQLDYYRSLHKKNGRFQYGRALSGDAVCILLHVKSDSDFEEIIQNDPALDKAYELDSVLAFSNLL